MVDSFARLLALGGGDLSDYYTKEQVDQIVATLKANRFIAVSVLPTPSADTVGSIYLIPSSSSEEGNIKEEYITVETDDDYEWELIGSTAIDLSGYYTKVETDTLFYNKTEVDDLLEDKQDTLTAGNGITISGNVISSSISYVEVE